MQTATARPWMFERFASYAAMVVGLGGFIYAILFVTLLHKATKGAKVGSSILLMVGGILLSAVLIAVYERVRATDPGFALWGLILGLAGAFGSALHGGYDLAPLAHKVQAAGPLAANPTDPYAGNVPYQIAGKCSANLLSIYYHSAYSLEGGALQSSDVRAQITPQCLPEPALGGLMAGTLLVGALRRRRA